MRDIDYNQLTNCRTQAGLAEMSSEIVGQFPKDQPPCLAELILNLKKGSQHILIELGRLLERRNTPDAQRYKWRLLVLKDEWGQPPVPGEKVIRKISLPLKDAAGPPISSHDISVDVANGTYDKKYKETVEFEIDEKGCITCEFDHAMAFISTWGVHPVTRINVGRHAQEFSTEPVDCPLGGKRHVHYWRYKEVTPEEYERLPVLKKQPAEQTEQSKRR